MESNLNAILREAAKQSNMLVQNDIERTQGVREHDRPMQLISRNVYAPWRGKKFQSAIDLGSK